MLAKANTVLDITIKLLFVMSLVSLVTLFSYILYGKYHIEKEHPGDYKVEQMPTCNPGDTLSKGTIQC